LDWIRTGIDGIFKIGMIEFVFGLDVLGMVLVYGHGDTVGYCAAVETGGQTSGAVMGYRPITTKILAESRTVISANVQWFAADGTVLEILGELLVALLVHDMWTVGWFDDFFSLETCGKRFAANST
jgi:hypothetical protein